MAKSGTKDIYEEGRQAAASLLALVKLDPARKTFVFVDNRFEGNALATIAASSKFISPNKAVDTGCRLFIRMDK